jgi:hypothetical protein
LQGRAQETRGQGTAEATVTMRLAEAERTTTGTVSAELNLSGKAAAMGKSVIGGVTEQMMALFAANLQALLAEPAPEEAPEASPQAPPQSRAEPGPVAAAGIPAVPAGVAPAAPVAATVSAPESAPSVPPSDNSLNVLSLAKGMITEQLSSPGKLLGLLAAVAFCAYRLGRRAGLRSART